MILMQHSVFPVMAVTKSRYVYQQGNSLSDRWPDSNASLKVPNIPRDKKTLDWPKSQPWFSSTAALQLASFCLRTQAVPTKTQLRQASVPSQQFTGLGSPAKQGICSRTYFCFGAPPYCVCFCFTCLYILSLCAKPQQEQPQHGTSTRFVSVEASYQPVSQASGGEKQKREEADTHRVAAR